MQFCSSESDCGDQTDCGSSTWLGRLFCLFFEVEFEAQNKSACIVVRISSYGGSMANLLNLVNSSHSEYH